MNGDAPGTSRLRARLADIDRRRLALLDELEGMDPALLARRPRADRWSIREIVEHLVLAERDVLRGMPDVSALREGRRGLRTRLAYPLVMSVLRFGIPVRVPSRAMVPAGDIPLAELRAMWDENHRWLREYVDGLDRRGLRRAVFRHPVTGPITVRQAVAMLDAHLKRHRGQIRQVLGARPGAATAG